MALLPKVKSRSWARRTTHSAPRGPSTTSPSAATHLLLRALPSLSASMSPTRRRRCVLPRYVATDDVRPSFRLSESRPSPTLCLECNDEGGCIRVPIPFRHRRYLPHLLELGSSAVPRTTPGADTTAHAVPPVAGVPYMPDAFLLRPFMHAANCVRRSSRDGSSSLVYALHTAG